MRPRRDRTDVLRDVDRAREQIALVHDAADCGFRRRWRARLFQALNVRFYLLVGFGLPVKDVSLDGLVDVRDFDVLVFLVPEPLEGRHVLFHVLVLDLVPRAVDLEPLVVAVPRVVRLVDAPFERDAVPVGVGRDAELRVEDAGFGVVPRLADLDLESAFVQHLRDECESRFSFFGEGSVVGEDRLVLAAQLLRGDDADLAVGLEGRFDPLEGVGEVLETEIAGETVVLHGFREERLIERRNKSSSSPEIAFVDSTPVPILKPHL